MIQVVPAITGLIDRLEKAGLVSRDRCQQDRRIVYVAITDKALALLEKLNRPVMDLHHRLVGHLTRAELETLIRLLEKTRAPLSAAATAE
jgi:DNA-binding MarR family transcriptional regulator